MNALFLELFALAVLSLLLLVVLTGSLYEWGVRAWRQRAARREIREEMQRLADAKTLSFAEIHRYNELGRRMELDAIVTAQDKATRRMP